MRGKTEVEKWSTANIYFFPEEPRPRPSMLFICENKFMLYFVKLISSVVISLRMRAVGPRNM